MALPLSDRLFDSWNGYLNVAPEGDLPEVAYHYTTAAGLFGILDKKCIYATDKRFLNDKTEVRHGTETAIGVLRSRAEKSSREPQRDLLKFACRYMETEGEERHFIFSMSERNDDLSQWRGYANEGSGFTIGFDATYFRKRSQENAGPFGFNRVSYSSTQFGALIAKLAAQYNEAVDAGEEADDVAMCFSGSLETAACYYKHNSFRFEREWRIVSYVYPRDPEEILVRNSGERLIPYIEMPLCQQADDKLPIVEIGIGPSVSNPNTRAVVEDLCNRARISPKIYNANTPYVRY